MILHLYISSCRGRTTSKKIEADEFSIKVPFSWTHRTQNISKNQKLYPQQGQITYHSLRWDTLYMYPQEISYENASLWKTRMLLQKFFEPIVNACYKMKPFGESYKTSYWLAVLQKVIYLSCKTQWDVINVASFKNQLFKQLLWTYLAVRSISSRLLMLLSNKQIRCAG